MRIILEAYNDYSYLNSEKDIYCDVIKEYLKSDYSLYEEIIKYWSCEGEELENCFVITAFIRSLQK